MNKNRYRVVFNKARNLMMAVAENTSSQGKGQQSGTGQPGVPEMHTCAKVIELFRLRPIAFAALCVFGMQPVILQAAVVADTNAATNNRPLVDTTANGLPLVQITTPSAAGVSRNQYSQFNVDPNGVILNNSQGNVLTQQGGYVGGNPYLANGSARIILNEVTSSGASSLRGYTEVAGQRAEVIIANPNGIVCDGCGFINTSRGILTTGVPTMGSGGGLDSFRVTGGQIQIGAGGLNATNVDQLDLITRSLQVNGQIWANNLNAVVGANQVDYTTLGVQVIAADANKPTVGIDVALLGGMYANKIRLVGTEAGVGVNSLGTVVAQAGDFTLNNQGNITLNGHTSSSANIVLSTQGDIANTGTVEGGTVTSSGNVFSNSGSVLADVLKIDATSLNNQGANAILSGNTSADLTVKGDINNAGTISGAAVTAHGNAFTNSGAVLADVVKLDATTLNNQGPQAKIAANMSVDLTVNGDIDNAGTISGTTVNTHGNAFNNSGSVLANALALNATSLNNQGANATIVGSNSVNLSVNGDIVNEGTINGDTVTSSGNAFNNGGSVLANALALNATSLNNQGTKAIISGNNSVDLAVNGAIANEGTVTGNIVSISSGAFNNSGSVLANALALNATGLSNQGVNAIISGNDSVDLLVNGDIVNEGTVTGSAVTTHGNAFNNSGSVLANALTLNASSLNNHGANATILGNASANLTVTGDINNASAISGDTVTTHSHAFTNSGAISTNALELNASSLNNLGANAIISGNALVNLSVNGDIVNEGTVTGGTVTTTANAFNNGGSVLANELTLNATSLSNQGANARITGNNSANLTVAGDINNAATISGGNVTTHSQAFTNSGAVLTNALDLYATSLNNQGINASILGKTSLGLMISGDIDNAGTITGGTITSQGNAFTNTGAVLANALTLNAASLNNQGADARIVGNNSANLAVSGDIVNDGTIMGGSITSSSNAFTNSATGGVFGDMVTLNANSLLNQTATSFISGHTSLDLNIAGDINNVGTLDGDTVTTHSNTFNNKGGVFGNDVTLNAATLNNTGNTAVIATTHALNLIVSDTINNTDGATLYSLGDLNAGASSTLDADGYLSKNMVSFNNTSATVQADGDLRISADQITNNRSLVQVDTTTTLPNVNTDVKTVTTDEHQIVSIVPDVLNLDGSTTYGSATTVDIHTVAQVQGGTTVLSYTVAPTEIVTVTPKPDPAFWGDSYDAQLATYNTLITPSTTITNSCQPCYSSTVATDSVNASTSARSNMLAGGNMHLKGAINNEFSTIAAGHDINFNANAPQTLTAGEYLTPDPILPGVITTSANGYTQKSQVLVTTETRDGTTDNWQWGVVGGIGVCDPICHWQTDYGLVNVPLPYHNTVTTLLDPSLDPNVSLSASFTAGNNIIGSAGYVNNHTINANKVSATLGALQTNTTAALQTSTTTAGLQTANTQVANTSTPTLNITLPKNSMFTYHTAPNQPYLIETNPRFTSYHDFLSSDYMLSRLTLDPQQIQKRLGDGFYEQKLVTDEITDLTGRRFLPGYTSAEAEFKAMMEQGLAEAHTQNLVPGVALTTAQTAALTHDIVWMVAQEVSLADGTTEKLLVPQVFLTRVHADDLRPNGSLIAAENIDIKTSGTLQNSGTILGNKTNTLSATDIVNQSGTLGGKGDTVLVASNDIKNLSGTINGVRVAVLAGHDVVNDTEMEALQLGNVFTTRIHNTAGIAAADTLDIRAGHDVSISGAKVTAGGNASIAAGNNFTVSVLEAKETAHLAGAPDKGAVNPDGSPNLQYALADFTRGDNGPSGGTSTTVNLTSQIQSGGNLTLAANNDLSMTAAQIYALQDLNLAARNISLGAAKDVAQSSYDDHIGNNTSRTDEKVVGTVLQAGNNVQLTASGRQSPSPLAGEGRGEGAVGNITISGSQISSQNGKVNLAADNNVTVNAVDEHHDFFEQRTSSSSGFLSSSTTTEITQTNQTIARGSSLDGDSITVKTGHDINVTGSDLVATHDLSLEAKNNIALQASENTYASSYFKEEHKSGLMSGGGLSISYGEQKQKTTQTGADISHTASNVGSLNGNVNIKAGNDYTQSGSNVSTPAGDISIAAQDVTIQEVQNTGINHSETKFEQSGLTLSLSNAVVDAANTVEQQRKAGSQTSSGRMKALAVANALMSTNNAIDTLTKGATGDLSDKVGGVSISLSVGGSTSESSSTQTHSTAQGSSVTAGGNINISATSLPSPVDGESAARGAQPAGGEGAGNESDDHDNDASKTKRGNITIQGSDIKAGNNTSLSADNDINLLAAKSTADQHSTNSSSSGSLGVGFSTAPKGGGLSVTASASVGRGNADGSDVSWTNTHVDAGNTLTLKSGHDTNMKGAVASGNQVVADIGGNLNIESLQDTSVYDSQQKSMGMSISVPIAGPGGGGSVNASNTNINSNYASVVEQSGIKAGDGGYKVNVKGNTDLKGAVITSSDEGLTQSTFKTGGTLTQSDIHNSASYNAEAEAVSAGVGSVASASAGLGEDKGQASATTKSGIGVSTKTDTTGAIAKIFDANKVTDEVNAQVQITQTFSQLAPKAVADFSATRAKSLLEDAKNENDPLKKQALLDDAAKWDEGGIYRIALHTVSGALGGSVDGAAGALTTASAAPLLDEMQANVQSALINQGMSEEKAKLIAQSVAEVTSAGMGYASGGLQGAATGLTVDTNNRQLHQDENKALAKLKQGKNEKEQHQLDAAACALAKCAEGVPETDKNYAKLNSLQQEGDQYKDEQRALTTGGLFTYGNRDTFNDYLTKHDEAVSRTGGAVRFAGGAVGTVGGYAMAASGVATCETGVGCLLVPAGVALTAFSYPDMKAGNQQMLGQYNSTEGQRVLDSFGTETYPGERDRVNELGWIGGVALAQYGAAKIGFKVLDKVYGDVNLTETTATAVGKKLDEVLDKQATDALIKSGGVLKNGEPILDLKQLTNEQKGVMGDLFGADTVKQIVPDGQKLARMPAVGETGIDDLYKVNRPDVDYVIVEHKFVGDYNKPGSSSLGSTTDGKQGADSWVLGSDRLEKSVGREIAPEIRRSFDSGRTETWVVTTRPDGSTEIQVLDSLGKPKPIDTSGILPKTNLSGAKP